MNKKLFLLTALFSSAILINEGECSNTLKRNTAETGEISETSAQKSNTALDALFSVLRPEIEKQEKERTNKKRPKLDENTQQVSDPESMPQQTPSHPSSAISESTQSESAPKSKLAERLATIRQNKIDKKGFLREKYNTKFKNKEQTVIKIFEDKSSIDMNIRAAIPNILLTLKLIYKQDEDEKNLFSIPFGYDDTTIDDTTIDDTTILANKLKTFTEDIKTLITNSMGISTQTEEGKMIYLSNYYNPTLYPLELLIYCYGKVLLASNQGTTVFDILDNIKRHIGFIFGQRNYSKLPAAASFILYDYTMGLYHHLTGKKPLRNTKKTPDVDLIDVTEEISLMETFKETISPNSINKQIVVNTSQILTDIHTKNIPLYKKPIKTFMYQFKNEITGLKFERKRIGNFIIISRGNTKTNYKRELNNLDIAEKLEYELKTLYDSATTAYEMFKRTTTPEEITPEEITNFMVTVSKKNESSMLTEEDIKAYVEKHIHEPSSKRQKLQPIN